MIPCKDCITFAVCKAQTQGPNQHTKVHMRLIPKCSLLQEYIKPIWDSAMFNYSPGRVDMVVYFFTHNKEYLNGTM